VGLFSFITDPLQSLFTGRGQNAYDKQQQGQQQVGNYGLQGLNISAPNWLNQLKYAQSFNPQLQQGLSQLGSNLTQQGLRDNAINGGNAIVNQAQSSQVPLADSGNPWMAQAYHNNAINQAQQQANQSLQQAYTPEAQARAFNTFSQAIGNFQNSAYQPLGQSAGLVYGQPQVQVQPGLMDQISGALGSYLGGLGKSSGGGGYSGSDGPLVNGINYGSGVGQGYRGPNYGQKVPGSENW